MSGPFRGARLPLFSRKWSGPAGAGSGSLPINEDDHRYFSHYQPRMLSAEQIVDALGAITGRPMQFAGVPASMKATELPAPDLKPHDRGKIGEIEFMKVFGQPERQTVCECERGDDSSLGQALELFNGKLMHGMITHSDWLYAVTWDSAGHRIATASRDKSAKVFDVAAGGKRLATFSGHSETVRAVGFHPNGNEVISCGDHGLVLRWKISNGKKSGDLAKIGGPALRMLCSESGYFVAGPKGQIVQLKLDDQKRERELVVAGERLPAMGEVVEHGSRLAVGTFDGRVVFFDLETGRPVREFIAAPGL